jgi:hypothetical protein
MTAEAGSSWPVFPEVGQVVAVTALMMEGVQGMPGHALEPGSAEQLAGAEPGPRLAPAPGQQRGQEHGREQVGEDEMPLGSRTLAHSPKPARWSARWSKEVVLKTRSKAPSG